MTTALWWIRRDLRLTDNQALQAAMEHGKKVLPVFVLDPVLLTSQYMSAKRLDFLHGGLRKLGDDLRQRGSRLIVRRGRPPDVLKNLMVESGADTIFAEEDFSPYARRRDRQVAENLPLTLTSGLTVRPPGSVLKQDGTPFRVFTPFSRAWKTFSQTRTGDLIPAPEHISTPEIVRDDAILNNLSIREKSLFVPGEEEARRRLHTFITEGNPPVYQYATDRNHMSIAGTSGLSPYLRFGIISSRQVVAVAYEAIEAATDAEAAKGAEMWLNELIWREFFIHILYHFPEVRKRSFRIELDNIKWGNDEADFAAWCAGQTGYPVVDAAMRQLTNTGWMHNRARMIAASFLVKDLLIDWRWGERWFMQQLVDGDPAANNGGWQWTAGTGTDAAPYFRIFNPILQGKKYDPDGAYVRRWVPELAQVPDKYIHAPWEMPPTIQATANCVIGKDYPIPIVDHAWACERTLVAYSQAKEEA